MKTFIPWNNDMESRVASFILDTASSCLVYGLAIKVFKAVEMALISYVG